MSSFMKFVLLATLALCAVAQQQPADQGTNYNAGDHGRSETVSPDGEVTGQYHYTDSDGKLITVKYRAGKDGFQVEGDHLPKAPQPQQVQPQYNGQPQQQQQQFFQPQQQQQQFYNPQQQQSNLFQNFGPQQQFQPQPQYQPQQQQFQQQYQPQVQQFQPQQPQYQPHPNALPQQQYYNQGQQQQGQYRPSKVSVSQNPGSGFTYNIES